MNNDLPVHPDVLKNFAEGRCAGEGFDYKAWIEIYELTSSDGKRHRLTDSRHGKLHHLLSLGERAVFLNADLDRSIDWIYEQWAWPIEDSRAVAKEFNIQHPNKGNHLTAVQTDFVFQRNDGSRFARTYKQSADLADPKVLVSLHIDMVLNHRAGITDWGIYTELDTDFQRADNWANLKEYAKPERLGVSLPDVEEIAAWCESRLAEATSFRDLAKFCGHALAVSREDVLKVYRHLLATRRWKINLSRPLDFSLPFVCRETVIEKTEKQYADTSA